MMRDDDDEMIGWGFGCSDGLRQPIGPPREVGATVVVASLFVLLKHRAHIHTDATLNRLHISHRDTKFFSDSQSHLSQMIQSQTVSARCKRGSNQFFY